MNHIPKGKVLLLAVFLALVASSLVYVFLSKQHVDASSDIPVLVATRAIPSGVAIDTSMLRVREMKKNEMPTGAVVDTTVALGQVTKAPMGAGEIILASNLTPNDRLSYIVPPMMRAVTVALDPIIGVGGFLKPGDHVDVIATFALYDSTVTKTVLQDVMLLATGPDIEKATKNDENINSEQKQVHATLAVLPADAERLILADSKGKLRLSLRRPDDPSHVRTRGITGRDMIGVIPTDIPKTIPSALLPVMSEPAKSLPQPSPVSARVIRQSDRPMSTAAAGAPVVQMKTAEKVKTIQVIRGSKVEDTVIQR